MYPILDTRVECKVIINIKCTLYSVIRIEPDWNVKKKAISFFTILKDIRIEPDWA